MKVGDLVKVSNKGFTAIGYIKEKTGHVYCTVRYLAILEDHGEYTNRTGGLWSEQYMALLKEVKHEKDTCTT